MISIVFVMVLPWLLIATGAWLGYQLLRQNGRILLRLDSIEKQLGPRRGGQPREAGGLPAGTAAPDFELPDLTGARRKLSDFRGRPVLLIFLNPACGHCVKMASDLAALPADGGAGRPMPLVVTSGDPEENRKFVELHGIRCLVLLQEQIEVASRFRAPGTPMGYRIDGEGRIASELAVGAEPLLRLASTTTAVQDNPAAVANDFATNGGKGDPSLARSRLNRNGLKAGVMAPEFRLPLVDGGELSLADFRGGCVLLVFSDPECGPCDELAPRLQRVHEDRPDLRVVVVSRRDIDANRAKATALGLTFPIALQRQWEVSREYGMFATPIAYLIDERGLLLSNVAVGVGPILKLVEEPVRGPYADAELSASGM